MLAWSNIQFEPWCPINNKTTLFYSPFCAAQLINTKDEQAIYQEQRRKKRHEMTAHRRRRVRVLDVGADNISKQTMYRSRRYMEADDIWKQTKPAGYLRRRLLCYLPSSSERTWHTPQNEETGMLSPIRLPFLNGFFQASSSFCQFLPYSILAFTFQTWRVERFPLYFPFFFFI